MSGISRGAIDVSDKKKELFKRLQKEAALRLSRQQGTSAANRLQVARRADRSTYPLSFLQERFWWLEQLSPGDPTLQVLAVIRLDGELDMAVLRQSVQALIQRHELLRAVFANLDGTPVQSIMPVMPAEITLLDLAHLELDASEQAQEQLLLPHQPHTFDLANGPLFKVTLVTFANFKHLLVLSLHAIIADQSTSVLLCQELMTLYFYAITGQHIALPELSLTYADYASWQRQHLVGAVLEERQTYWKQQLAGATLMLNLPFDHQQAATAHPRQATFSAKLDAPLIQQAREFCQQEKISFAHLLFTVFALLLGQYTGQKDLLAGFLSPHRAAELEPVAGPFANVLPVRVQLADALSGQALCEHMQRSLDAAGHQELPCAHIVEAAYPQLDPTRMPLFQVSFAFHELPIFVQRPSGLMAQLLPLVSPLSLQDLAFAFSAGDQSLDLTIAYNSDLFAVESIARLQQHYQQLLQSFLHNYTAPITRLSCLTCSERTSLLRDWNAESLAHLPAPGQCIQHLFEQQAERTPQAIALSAGGHQLTYDQLNCQANRLAHLLRRRGIGPEHLVGLCLSRTLELVVGLLAILKAGAAYVPLDPTYPRERLAFTIQDAGLALVLTQRELVDQMPFSADQALCLDDPALYAGESPDNIAQAMSNKHLAYVIYTSGSTGRPKGVCISHWSAVIFLLWARQQFSDEELAGVLFGTSICFDLSIFELFAPLSWGGKVILASTVLDLPALAESEQVTLLNTVPSAAAALLNGTGLPASILTVNLAGEALTRDLVQSIYQQSGVQRVCNLYGPTEDTTYSTWATISAKEQGAVPIGRPLAQTQAYIVDAHMQPVPVGIAGELYLGGDGQARGYLNRPDLTAERFIPAPFSATPGRRLYKTGDLARYRPDGTIDYLGRLDHQVKVRGFRIELGEIEARLRQHPAVEDVVVVAWEERPGEKRLVAYVVARATHAVDASTLRQYLLDILPAYMIPSFFIVLDSLPRTENGKVDRKALPVPDPLKAHAGTSPLDMPQSEREQWLALLWQEILQLSQVGRSDNFFAIGGDSLRAMQLLARLRNDFQLRLSLEDLFAAPTIAQLAARCQTVSLQPALKPIAPLQPRMISPDAAFPLSLGQQRLWFVDQLEAGTAMYNVPLILSLVGSLNRLALYQAIHEMIRRHESLRTTIQVSKGSPFLSIADCPKPAFSIVDLSGCLAPTFTAENLHDCPVVLGAMREEVCRPFDLAAGPLLRVRLLCIREDYHILMLTMHHIITDGWSLNILTRELNALYNAFIAGRLSPLPEPPIQYRDFVVWQRTEQAPNFAAGLAYWKECLTPLPPTLALPTDHPRPPVQTFTGASPRFQISHELREQIHGISQQEGVTPFMTLLTAFLVLLMRYSGQEDLVVGTPVANRPRTELEDLVGFFVNTLALRADLSGSPTGRELLHRVRAVTLDAYTHQEIPFEQVVEAVQPQRDPARSPLFQVLFVLQNTPSFALNFAALSAQSFEILPPAAQFDLSLILEEGPSGLNLTIECNTQLFERTTIERLQLHYQTLLRGLCARPDALIQDLPLLTEREYRQLVHEWNRTAAAFPADRCLHELFTEQAERTPIALALQDGSRCLSYQELDQQANQLAHLLRRRGVGPDVPVGLYLERSIEQMIGLLAILKAGGTYVPLDTNLPPERLEYLLLNAGIKLVLTREAYRKSFRERGCDCLCLSSSQQLFAAESQAAPVSGVRPHNLAYVIYTSGSTGYPKGVLISHYNVVSCLSGIAQHYQLGTQDRLLQFNALSFDTSIEEIFHAWLRGAALVLRPADLHASFEQLHRWLEEQQITVMDIPTAYWHAWVQELKQRPLLLPSSLRLLIIGGEKAEAEHLKHWLEVTGNKVRLSNTYGPTETTITATLYDVPVDLSAADAMRAFPIGWPVPNMRCYVLDAQLHPVPVGVRGELYLAGEAVSRGYLGRPALTARRFLPDPLSEQPGQRMYRTGDQVYQRADGALIYVERVDQQIKLRGYRIELGEIEHILREQPKIQAAVVLLREEQPGRSQLVAYVQPEEGHTLELSWLRLSLKKRLPSYMLPAVILPVNSFPLTVTGKIDRKQLPAPEQLHLIEHAIASPPQGSLEETLAGIWKNVLRIALVGREDNFFEIGGHSLLAMQVLAAIREELHMELSIRQFFAAPTIADLATAIASTTAPGQKQVESLGSMPLVPVARTGDLPLSFAQQRLWFLDQLEGSSATYTIPVVLQLTGPFNLPVFRQSMRELVRRHEVLRTTFIKGPNGPIQCIHLLPAIAIEVMAVPAGEPEQRQAAISQDIRATVQRPFDLASGPLLRVRILRLEQQRHIMIFTMHHIISDGWS